MASGDSSRKRKSAALESIEAAPAPAAIAAPDPLPGADEDDGGAEGEEGGGADRLSSLPDDVLSDILSLLTAKEAARTGILASRWRDLWLSAPLNLDCRDFTAIGPDAVSRILSSHHGPVRRLYFNNARGVTDNTVVACLRSAALDNLEELDFTYYHRPEQPIRALIFRFSHTLSVANLRSCDLSDVSFQGLHFRVLKHLGLLHVTISELSLDSLIAGCPALEFLLIYQSYSFRCVRINSLTIKAICLCFQKRDYLEDMTKQKHIVIENAPCLLRLLLEDYSGDNLQVSVLAAPKLETLGFIGNDRECVISTLVFDSTVIQGLRIDKLVTDLRTIKILAIAMDDLCLDTVIELMRCFPCLEKLYTKSYHRSKHSNCWRRKHRNLIRCLDLRLKTIVLTNYRGSKSQVNFLTFFVLNANLLESVTLGIDVWSKNEKFFAEQNMKLQIENRVSRDVSLHFRTAFGGGIRSFYDLHVRDLESTDPFTCM